MPSHLIFDVFALSLAKTITIMELWMGNETCCMTSSLHLLLFFKILSHILSLLLSNDDHYRRFQSLSN